MIRASRSGAAATTNATGPPGTPSALPTGPVGRLSTPGSTTATADPQPFEIGFHAIFPCAACLLLRAGAHDGYLLSSRVSVMPGSRILAGCRHISAGV